MVDLQEMIESTKRVKIGNLSLSDPYSPVLNAKQEVEDAIFYLKLFTATMEKIIETAQSICDDYYKNLTTPPI